MKKNTEDNKLEVSKVEKVQTKIDNKQVVHRELSIHRGPLPSPEQLEKYEQICPGAAKDIINMAINQSKHRQEMEKLDLKSAARDSLLGLIFAFIFCLVTIGGAIYLINEDHTISGTILGGVGFSTVVTAFIQGRMWNKDNESNNLNN